MPEDDGVVTHGGSAYTVKEILVALDQKIDRLFTELAVMRGDLPVDLHSRLRQLEGFHDQMIGTSRISVILASAAAGIAILGAILALFNRAALI